MAFLIKQGKLLNGRPQEKWRSDSEEEDQKTCKIETKEFRGLECVRRTKIVKKSLGCNSKTTRNKKNRPKGGLI